MRIVASEYWILGTKVAIRIILLLDCWDLIQTGDVFSRRCSRYDPNVASKVILPVAFVGAVNTLVSVYAAHSVGDMRLD